MLTREQGKETIMEIKEFVKKMYSVNGEEFESKSEAEQYLNHLENDRALLIYTNPDLSKKEANFQTVNIFRVPANQSSLSEWQTIENLVKLVENIMSSQVLVYQGVKGTMRLARNFIIEVKKYKELEKELEACKAEKFTNSCEYVEHQDFILLENIFNSFDDTMIYLEKVILNNISLF